MKAIQRTRVVLLRDIAVNPLGVNDRKLEGAARLLEHGVEEAHREVPMLLDTNEREACLHTEFRCVDLGPRRRTLETESIRTTIPAVPRQLFCHRPLESLCPIR